MTYIVNHTTKEIYIAAPVIVGDVSIIVNEILRANPLIREYKLITVSAIPPPIKTVGDA